MKSKWKQSFNFVITKETLHNIKTPSSVIVSAFVGLRVNIYNGRKFLSLLIRDYMVGFRFAQFISTKRTGDFHPQKFKKKIKSTKNSKKL